MKPSFSTKIESFCIEDCREPKHPATDHGAKRQVENCGIQFAWLWFSAIKLTTNESGGGESEWESENWKDENENTMRNNPAGVLPDNENIQGMCFRISGCRN